jgi:hypothetical protein
LTTFLTQIGPTLPLTPDPSVICFWKWIGWKDYEVPKNHNLERVSTKNELVFSPTRRIPTLCTRRAHLSLPRRYPLRIEKNLLASSRRHPHGASSPGGAAPTLATTLLLASLRHTPRDSRPPHVVRRGNPLLRDPLPPVRTERRAKIRAPCRRASGRPLACLRGRRLDPGSTLAAQSSRGRGSRRDGGEARWEAVPPREPPCSSTDSMGMDPIYSSTGSKGRLRFICKHIYSCRGSFSKRFSQTIFKPK